MEATGVYWIPIFEILDAHGFQEILVNARHVKNPPGRKSDVSGCEWLRDDVRVGRELWVSVDVSDHQTDLEWLRGIQNGSVKQGPSRSNATA